MKEVLVAAALILACVTGAFAGEQYKQFYDKGVELNKKGDFKGAIASYTKAIALKKDAAFLYYVRGRAYKQDGQYEQAMADLTNALTLDPKYAEAYNHRGALYVGYGKKELALADFRKACDLKNEGGCTNFRKLQGNGK